jgi:hypothetical protein
MDPDATNRKDLIYFSMTLLYSIHFRTIFDIRRGRMDRWSGENRQWIEIPRAGVVGEKEENE